MVYLNVYYLFVFFISPLSIFVLMFEPDVGQHTAVLNNICLITIPVFGLSGLSPCTLRALSPAAPELELYLKAIEPFRRYIVYPTIMKKIKNQWQKD